MSTDFNGREPDTPITDQQGTMFAASPIWERNRKKKGFGARKAAPAEVVPEPRVVDTERGEEPMMLDTPVASPIAGAAAHRETRAEEAAPNASATPRAQKSRGLAPAAIAAGVVALGALGATGWYMSRDNAGMPELAPGSTTTEVAAAPPAPAANAPAPIASPPTQLAANETPPPAAAEPRATETPRATLRRHSTARVRPATAAAPSASTEGVNASTTAAPTDGPQPYSSLGGTTTAPTQVNPPLVTLPPAATEAPAAVPQSPATMGPEAAPAPEAPAPTTPQ